jgi:succinate-semialdehyde dehydrogenase/glutarate-semialdehyde dehydrogenase
MAIVENVQVNGDGRRKMRLASPATGQPIGDSQVTTADEVRAAVARARKAQPAWEALGFKGRAAVFQRALDILLRKQEEMMDVIIRETGRSRFETIMMEIFPACDSLSYYAKHAERLLRDRKVGMHLLRTKKLLVSYRPLGVIGIITPWNGPFILSLNPSVQALMAGNAVVLKPSEVTPFSGRLVGELLREAGIPEDVFTVVEGDGETGAALLDAGVDKISFTGSVRTGRKVGEACGRNLIPCTLELGGKDPMVVCADADVTRAAGGAVFGAFMNAGQFCCSTERVYVVDSIADEFTRQVVEKTRALKLGKDGDFDIGPMIWPRQLETIERHVADAIAKGARVLTGGRRATEVGDLFYEPTVLVDVTHDMAIMREETFGPILPIFRVPDEQEALRLANDTVYGLAANVWTRDDAKGVRLAKQLCAGSVTINETAIAYGAVEAPFGGRRTSGVGQVNGEAGLRGYCFAQPIITDRFNLKAEQVWYPYTAEKAKSLQKVMRWLWGTRVGRWLA